MMLKMQYTITGNVSALATQVRKVVKVDETVQLRASWGACRILRNGTMKFLVEWSLF